MSASDFFGVFSPVFLILLGAALFAFALECAIGSVALVAALLAENRVRREARAATTVAGISRTGTAQEQSSVAAGTGVPTIGHGDPADITLPPTARLRRSCKACDALRALFLPSRRAPGE